MRVNKNLWQKTSVRLSLAVMLLTACASPPATTVSPTSSLEVATDTLVPSATFTPLPTQTETPTLVSTPDIWEIQKCPKAPNVIGTDYGWIWNYTGDIEGRGEVDMLLNFTENNEIQGFAFDIEQVIEYRMSGCVEGRLFIIWLQQEDTVKAVIQGEFPETDPRGHYSASSELSSDVITGSLIEKGKSESFPIYLHLSSGTAGTMDHRFELAGAYVDKVILNASHEFLAAIANDDRAQVVEMVRFPVDCYIRGEWKKMETSEMFLANYDDIFGDGFKERLAITFPNYLMAQAGLFLGTISQFIYGGGGINFDEHGKVTEIYNRQKPINSVQSTCFPPPADTPVPPLKKPPCSSH